jgi:hypothetical protein
VLLGTWGWLRGGVEQFLSRRDEATPQPTEEPVSLLRQPAFVARSSFLLQAACLGLTMLLRNTVFHDALIQIKVGHATPPWASNGPLSTTDLGAMAMQSHRR